MSGLDKKPWERWLQERGQGEKATAKVFLWMGVLTLPLLPLGIGFLLTAGIYVSIAGQAEVRLYREMENALPALQKACQDLADF